jgi:predicted RNA-binding Zn-ribbon protein involved in translation (DUF1610 family)
MTDIQNNEEIKFICPNCGEISRDDVVFLCNKCRQEELIFQDGVYMCPACLVPGDNFQCMLCDSKEVVMKKPAKKHTVIKGSHRNTSSK